MTTSLISKSQALNLSAPITFKPAMGLKSGYYVGLPGQDRHAALVWKRYGAWVARRQMPDGTFWQRAGFASRKIAAHAALVA